MARDDLSRTQTVTVAAIEMAVPSLVQARDIVDAFHTLIRRKKEEALEEWLEKAAQSLLAPFGDSRTDSNAIARGHVQDT